MFETDEGGFPFTEAFQEAIIGHCLSDQQFFMKCHQRLKSKWFTRNGMLSNAFEQMSQYYKEHGVPPGSVEDLINEPFFLRITDKEKGQYRDLLNHCVNSRFGQKGFHLDNIKKKLTGFVRLSLLRESIEGAASRYRQQKFDDAYDWARLRIKEIQEASFEDDQMIMEFDNPEVWLKEESEDAGLAISTGSKLLDLSLGGGLFRSETSAIMAPVNTGKSTFMITIARHAAFQGYKVLYITHEDSPKKIRRKLLSAFLGVTRNTLLNKIFLEDSSTVNHVKTAALYLKEHVMYMPYNNTNGMFVEDLCSEIKKRNEYEKLMTGRGFDIIIDDYPKKLKLRNRSKEGLYRAELGEVYDYFNQLAIELNVHCFVAIQTNREGMKQNLGKVKSDSYIDMSQVDESYAIAQNLGNIIALNRSPDDKRKHVLRLSITKSRNDITDIAINTRTNYGCTLTHGDPDMFMFDNLFKEFIKAKVRDSKQSIEKSLSLKEIESIDSNIKKMLENSRFNTELRSGFLAAIGQASNRIIPVETIDEALMRIERGDMNTAGAIKQFEEELVKLQGVPAKDHGATA